MAFWGLSRLRCASVVFSFYIPSSTIANSICYPLNCGNVEDLRLLVDLFFLFH